MRPPSPPTMLDGQSAVVARALGMSWPLQALVVAVWLWVPHPPDAHEWLVGLVTLAAAPLYLPLLRRDAPPPTRLSANAGAVAGIAHMCALVWAGGGMSSGFWLLALWFLPVVVTVLPRRDIAVLIALIVAGCATAAAVGGDPTNLLRKRDFAGFAVVGLATLLVNTAIVAYLHGVLRDTSDRFAHRKVHDPLTGLPNRALLNARLADHDREGAVYILDVDGFTVINDSLGHHAGDELLRAIAGRLRHHAGDGDVLARIAGDEFGLLAAGIRDEASALALGRRLLDACEAPFRLDGELTEVSVTAGVALLADAGSGELALRNADLALHAARADQAGTIRVFAEPMRQLAATRLSLERHLRRALARGELSVVYQPVVELESGRPLGAEALLRWRSAALGDVSPADFVPVAERTGLIVPIGRFVMTRAIEQLAAWRAAGHDLRVSINLSAAQLADDGLAGVLAALLERHRVPGEAVLLELTETALMSRATARPLAALDRLRATGALLVLDDFGTGYSSLSRLSRLRLASIKVDRSFVAKLDDDPTAHAIVAAVLQMARPLGTVVVAEGVETEAQRSALVALGCPLGQGWLFGRPGPADAVVERLAVRAA